MPSKPRSVCLEPRCGALVDPGMGGYCPAHQHRTTASRQSLYKTPDWQRMRAAQLAANPYCKCGAPATVADHDIPHRGDLGLFFDRRNLVSMCVDCHNRKSSGEVQNTGEFLR